MIDIDDIWLILLSVRFGRFKHREDQKKMKLAKECLEWGSRDGKLCETALFEYLTLRLNGYRFYEIYNNIGVSFTFLKSYDNALKAFDIAISMKEKNLILRHNRAGLRYLTCDFQGANDDYLVVKETLKKAEGLHPWYKERINKSLQAFTHPKTDDKQDYTQLTCI